ncbi:MAG: SDR family NAD(P)-dependent oxidoreductase, partial [Actinobacteria bacterium]|nr:SDR family NAD(P)-dependent oxidoreductase [Actinomycetota bacterium]
MAKQERNLVGQIVAITGGARGIGKSTAQTLSRAGMKVAIGDLDGPLAAQTAEEIGAGTIGLQLDVTDFDSFSAFVASVQEQMGPIDVIINNAGIMQLGPYLDEDMATTKRMIDINIYGVDYGCRLTIPSMVARGHGHVVNIASAAGKAGYAHGATYCGTKHYVVGMSEAIRSELRGTGVEVSCVMPVAVQTELGGGLAETRAVKQALPQDVADEILSALKQPRFDVFVPRSVGPLNQVMSVMGRGPREALGRALKADKVLSTADHSVRKDYELRATRSAP